ncbi:MAG: cisplatin damage response ATP-dependent DNA ligase, partial [Bermanella sp.]
AELLIDYLHNASRTDRGWAVAAIAGTLSFEFFKRKLIKDLIVARVDPVLFDLSYDYVGEMSETIAHLWSTCVPHNTAIVKELPSLTEVVTTFSSLPKADVADELVKLLNVMTPVQRWALLKLGTKGLRIGISARFLKKILSQYSQQQGNNISVEDIERVWHGVKPPYHELFDWLDGKANMPDVSNQLTFQPVMLAHPISDDTLNDITSEHWQAEWKYDGIRAQLVRNNTGAALFSRTGDDISNSFPEFISAIEASNIVGRFDGELLALQPASTSENHNASKPISMLSRIASFNQLQQRLNKKRPAKALIQNIPVGMIVYDVLDLPPATVPENQIHTNSDVRALNLSQRHELIHEYLQQHPCEVITGSSILSFNNSDDLAALKDQANELGTGYIEGLMLKRKAGNYKAGRPTGEWYKLKRDPKLIDAVIMYAQRGHGKRSSFYSDFTFGCWQQETLLPIGKAYSGFTNDELRQLDTWVRRNTIGRFGPVKEVNKALVFEIAFDSVHTSNRHKSKVALRFPRIHRIRWDKPANEADQLSTLVNMIE